MQDLIKCHRIDITLQTDTLSRSEASRLIDQIILQRGRLTEHSLSSPYNGFAGRFRQKEGIAGLKEVKKCLNMRDHKTKKIISTIIVVILVLAMIVPMALSALMY